MSSKISIGGGLARQKIWDGKLNTFVFTQDRHYCDYCGTEVWKGFAIAYDDEDLTFNVCETCLLLVFKDTDAGKILMLQRKMEDSAGIDQENGSFSYS